MSQYQKLRFSLKCNQSSHLSKIKHQLYQLHTTAKYYLIIFLKSGLKLGEQNFLLCIGCHIIVTVKRTLQVKIVLVCFSRGRSPEQSSSSFSTSCVCTHCWLLSPSAASASSLVFVGHFLARWASSWAGRKSAQTGEFGSVCAQSKS